MRRLLIGVALMISLATRIQPLGAQSPVSVGVGAGPSLPAGALQDDANLGWRALASLDVGLPELPTSLRVDAAYDHFGHKSTAVGSAEQETGAQTIASVSLGLSIGSNDSLPRFSPYAVAGLTMSRVGCAGRSDCEVSRAMGWNGGVGLRFILFGRRAFADARVYCVVQAASDLCYVPVSVGLLFGAQAVNVDAGTSTHRSRAAIMPHRRLR